MTISIAITTFICCCNAQSKKLEGYTFVSIKYWDREIFDIGSIDVIDKIEKAREINGPVKGIIVKNLILVNRSNNDTIEVIIYGIENELFEFNQRYYKSSQPIVPLNLFDDKSNGVKN